ncbi:hypothetical protein [Salinarimonas rosea]|uniref:hypothetical protein n=1 Tax=Salinarimonas rosea TaxID=552063 RepID=UPI0012EC75CC|nr:hypothetical protein [Salinarimonas rosea]
MNSPNISGDAFAARLQALRSKTGLVDERVLQFRCAVTGNPFSVRFTRESPALRYRIAEVRAAEGGAGSGGYHQKDRSFPAKEFDLSGWRCPCCDDDDGFTICSGCGSNVCAGRTRKLPHGARLFGCHDGCGTSFQTAPCETVSGQSAPQRGLLSGPAQKKLPAPLRALTDRRKS